MGRRLLVWLVAAACGTDRVSRDVVDHDAPGMPEATPDAPGEPLAPTYYRDIAPILETRCAGCHVEGGVAPFALAGYAEAASRSQEIAAATTARVMPPWPADASGACGTFVDARWLSPAEIAMLAAWHATGAPAGDASHATLATSPSPPAFTPAVTLASSEPYLVRPGPDEYRCFVVDPQLTEDRYITAIALALDRPEVVHHMQLFAAFGATAETSIDQRDAADPGPGYACDDEGVGVGLRYVGVWAGGDLVRRWPEGSGVEIAAGHRLVLQLHYHNHGSTPVADRTALQLELASQVDHVGQITSTQLTHFELPAGLAETSVTTTGGLPISAPAWLRGARIHMHGYGASARMELVRGGTETCLLDIPRWQEGWQLFYRFAAPIDVAPGDQIRIRCSYDTRTADEPVEWGFGSDDEMCIAYTFVTP